MNPKLKLTAYAVLLILCAWFAWGFYSNYSVVTKPAPDAAANIDTNAPASTNAPTNSVATTNTNAIVTAGTNIAAAPGTNAIATPAQTNAPVPVVASDQKPASGPDVSARRSAMITYLAALVGSIIGLGLLLTSDVTQFLGGRAVDFLFDDSGEGGRDPEYERAEAEWANGKFLDAIQMMREFLKKNPRELYAALRIAEIYEKDLKNYLAAALEYEEILKHRFSSERWGWAAIHLCNLYSKLNQSDKALALLRRIAKDYPKTGAAKKARTRLGIAEPEEAVVPEEVEAEAEPDETGENHVIIMEEHPPELEPHQPAPPPPPPPPSEPSEPHKPNLPPGFRPKK